MKSRKEIFRGVIAAGEYALHALREANAEHGREITPPETFAEIEAALAELRRRTERLVE